ncbi:MAG: hypothetical protein ACFB2Z_01415 [Maricaulaceae bacterium]
MSAASPRAAKAIAAVSIRLRMKAIRAAGSIPRTGPEAVSTVSTGEKPVNAPTPRKPPNASPKIRAVTPQKPKGKGR